jgi:hypothetical protein
MGGFVLFIIFELYEVETHIRHPVCINPARSRISDYKNCRVSEEWEHKLLRYSGRCGVRPGPYGTLTRLDTNMIVVLSTQPL